MEYKEYLNRLDIEATIIHLSEVSDYTVDEILLFEYEVFILEVSKYDLKALAENKEHELMMKEMQRKAKIHNE